MVLGNGQGRTQTLTIQKAAVHSSEDRTAFSAPRSLIRQTVADYRHAGDENFPLCP